LVLWAFAAPAWAQAPASAADCTTRILAVHAGPAGADGVKPAAADWQAVSLPDEWNRRHPDFAGGSIWYRIDWRQDCPGAAREPVALLLQSVVLAGEVFVNGRHLWSDTHLTEPLSRSWNMPRQWMLPENWLHDGVNTIEVRVSGVAGQSVGLGPVFIGDPGHIGRLHDSLRWHHRTLFEINLIVSGIVGILFFCVWIMRRDQTFYGWYAFSSLFWMAFAANILIISPWPFTSSLMLACVNIIALLLSVACFCMFTWRFGEQQVRPRTERTLWSVTGVLIAALALAPLSFVNAAQWAGFRAAAIIFLANCLQFLVHAWRTRRREHAILAACLMVLPVAGLHDALVLTHLIDAQPIFPWSNIASTFALSAIMGLRHARNLGRIERFNEELAESVAKARRELTVTLEREHALALSHTRLQYQLQIAHDLHDGLGGALVHMMRSVERSTEPLAPPQVLSMLKFIRDDLRQTIDTNYSASVTIPATPQEWIAPLRHRFTAMFDELGIASEWLLPEAWRTPPAALQYLALSRLVEEALTNVIKHSGARNVQLRLDLPEADKLVLRVEDDGAGFDVAAVRQAGISIGVRSMTARIVRVGGSLDVVSEPGRTLLTARLTLAGA
jgi:signal transduction histidine kinase